jgi:regulator of replication initiation timing
MIWFFNRQWNQLLAKLNSIEQRIIIMGKVLDEVKAYAAEIDTETNRIAADLQALQDKLADTTTPEEVAAVLKPITDRLKLVGKNPPASA